MQKLSQRRSTNTPRNIPHVLGNCGATLNSPKSRGSVSCLPELGSHPYAKSEILTDELKTCDNNSDAALTAREQAGQDLRVPVVYVLNQRGEPLMPCSARKARILLMAKKAVVRTRTPFVIQLIGATGENKQPVVLGVDSGYLHVGLSAVVGKREVYAGDVMLRKDIVELNSERRQYRRARRNRKMWYRQPRFLNRKKAEGWLAPSIQHKLDSQVKLVDKVAAILPVTKVVVEVAAFDIQKIKKPDIAGTDYQNGEQTGFWNVREYVLYRDGHTCQHCKGKSKDKILHVHHKESRKTGGDRPENLVTLCETCHNKHHQGEIELNIKTSKGFKAETFMSMVRWKLVNKLRTLGYFAEHTYGYITKTRRHEYGVPKSHANDAFVIAGGTGQSRVSAFNIKQVRKCNRKLRKGDRSHLINTAPRFIHGFQRYDKVLFKGIECFIFGRRSKGYFDLRKLNGSKIHTSTKYSSIRLLEAAKTLLIQRICVPLGNELPSIRA